MTPEGWMSDTLAGWGAAWMFGGALLLAVPFGALLGWLKGAIWGIGGGLLLWGLGNLVISLMTASFVHLDSTVLALHTARCTPSVDHRLRAEHTLVYSLQRQGEPLREVSQLTQRGTCPDSDAGPYRVRVRHDSLASKAPRIAGEPADDDKPVVLMVLWGAFGGFAVLAAGLLLGSLRPRRPKAAGSAALAPRPVAAWRVSLGTWLGQLGGLILIAAFTIPWLLDGTPERAVQFGLRCLASALAMVVAAGLLARTMIWGTALFLVLFAGTALGVAEVLRRG